MKFERIELSNYRCFESETVSFEPGVNVIYGLNGSGKSTLLEAAFFALYGSAALRETGANLDDVVTNTADTAEVTLLFTVGGDQYTVTRVLKERGDRVSQTDAVLETPADVIDGARDVDAAIESMTRMDAKAFLNSAFVRQGEINTMVHSSSSERQRLIDRLLQLGKLEEYMDRASDVRVGVGRVRDKKENILDDRESEIASLRGAGVEETLRDVKSRIETRKSQRDTLRSIQSEYEDELSAVEDTIREQEELQESLADVEESLDDVEDRIDELETRRTNLADERDELHDEKEAKEDELHAFIEDQSFPVVTQADVSVHDINAKYTVFTERVSDARNVLTAKTSDRDSLQDTRDRLEQDIASVEAEIESLREKKEAKEDELESELRAELDEIQDEIASYENEIEELQAEFEDEGVEPGDVSDRLDELRRERDDLVDERSALQSDLQSKEDELERAVELRDAGKCPRCGQDVDGSPHVDQIGDLEEQINELETEVESVSDDIAGVEADIDELQRLDGIADTLVEVASSKRSQQQLLEKQESAIADAEDAVDEYAEQIEEKQEKRDELVDEVAELDDTIDSTVATIGVLESRIDALEKHASFFNEFGEKRDTIDSLNEEVESKQSEIEYVEELVLSKSEQADKLRESMSDIESDLDESVLSDARDRARELRDSIDVVSDAASDVEDVLSKLQERSGELRGKVTRLSSLEDEAESLEAQVDALDDLYDQMSDIENMYEELRGDLRQQNIRRLEELLNELFSVTYQNDAYDRIELDGEYNATVIEKTANEMSPDKLSGGESVLFNLSLRAAIYQLLVEGIGDSDTMPPLILDEPTAHLDEGHVEQIDDLVSRMRDIGVDQTVVVSHTAEIIDSSSHRIEVMQDGTTNRSSASAESDSLI